MAREPYEIDRHYAFDKTGSDRFDRANAVLDESNDGRTYVGRAVTLLDNDKVSLANDNEVVIGSFLYFNSGRAVVRVQSAGTKYKNGTANPLTVGTRIIGATRVIESGGDPQHGYVKSAPDIPSPLVLASSGPIIQRALRGRGTVKDGGGTYAANMDAPADVEVMQTMGA